MLLWNFTVQLILHDYYIRNVIQARNILIVGATQIQEIWLSVVLMLIILTSALTSQAQSETSLSKITQSV